VLRAPMPIAPINEQGDARAAKDQIRCDPSIGQLIDCPSRKRTPMRWSAEKTRRSGVVSRDRMEAIVRLRSEGLLSSTPSSYSVSIDS